MLQKRKHIHFKNKSTDYLEPVDFCFDHVISTVG